MFTNTLKLEAKDINIVIDAIDNFRSNPLNNTSFFSLFMKPANEVNVMDLKYPIESVEANNKSRDAEYFILKLFTQVVIPVVKEEVVEAALERYAERHDVSFRELCAVIRLEVINKMNILLKAHSDKVFCNR